MRPQVKKVSMCHTSCLPALSLGNQQCRFQPSLLLVSLARDQAMATLEEWLTF